ncbi:MAG: MtaA/CmuA family methyltransferase [Thermoleophilia bacterium]|nr:MtaA/CmuA family methyltransferase [Thermoleophilia bacterium]
MEQMSPKERLYATLYRQEVDRIPVAQPLQTGTVELMESCGAFWPAVHSDPELMATLAYEAHAKIGFESVRVPFDVNVESEALGCILDYEKGSRKGLDIQPSVKTAPISNLEGLEATPDPDPHTTGRMPVVLEAIRLLRKRLPAEIPILSAVVGPFMVAGQIRGVDPFMRELMREPDFVTKVVEKAFRACLAYAQAQVEAGSDVVVIVDASASPDLISPAQFDAFAKPYTKDLSAGVSVPTILHICGRTKPSLAHMAECANGVSIDSLVPMREAREIVGERWRFVAT